MHIDKKDAKHFFFSWLACLAAWILGACTQRRDDHVPQYESHTPANIKSCTLGLERTSLLSEWTSMLWLIDSGEVLRDHNARSGLKLIEVTFSLYVDC